MACIHMSSSTVTFWYQHQFGAQNHCVLQVHERTLQGDFLMALLKDILVTRRAARRPLKVQHYSVTRSASLILSLFLAFAMVVGCSWKSGCLPNTGKGHPMSCVHTGIVQLQLQGSSMTKTLTILMRGSIIPRNEMTGLVQVVLMSATLDSDMFARYYSSCSVLTAGGRTYPVEQHYLEDAYELTG